MEANAIHEVPVSYALSFAVLDTRRVAQFFVHTEDYQEPIVVQ